MGYYMTTVKAGYTMDVLKSLSKMNPSKTKQAKGSLTPEEIEKINQINAERKLRWKINANFGEGDYFLTLTYKKENRETPAEAKKSLKRFIDNLREEYKKYGQSLKYISVTEYENKAIHHHLIINDLGGVNVPKLINKLWPLGRPHYKTLDDKGEYRDLAAYLIKETSKTYKEKDGGHMQRYSCSRNLITPMPRTKIIEKAAKWLDAPKTKEGYWLDENSIVNGTNPFTGKAYQRYTLISLDAGMPEYVRLDPDKRLLWKKAKAKWENKKNGYQNSKKDKRKA